MKMMLVAVNAKYIHSNLAVYSLKAYAKAHGKEVGIAEFTVNQRMEHVLEALFRKEPDVVCFSCYIWNIEYIKELAAEYKKICPDTEIWAGGPEVSYDAESFLQQNPAFSGVLRGEGEMILQGLCCYFDGEKELADIKGITYRDGGQYLCSNSDQEILNMDEIPFAYEDISVFENRIIYYESSRGCPFSCSYCLSSIDKKLRFRSLGLVLPELLFFIEHNVPQVKFVDRTFNCRHEHAWAIWNFIKEHDNGVTNFHFEISADLLNEEEIRLIQGMRPGLIQLEIGIQSTNQETIKEISRSMKLEKVGEAVLAIQEEGNIHQHLDLIAGLPYEDYQSFQKSFRDIYALKPEQLQLGFLKVLKGSVMQEKADEYGLVFRSKAPYEVLATKWLTYQEMCNIHIVENMLEIHYNSGQFRTSLEILGLCFQNPFDMFLCLGLYYRNQGYVNENYSRMQRCRIFRSFAETVDPLHSEIYDEALLFDLYCRENMKSRPEWAPDHASRKRETMAFLRENGLEGRYCHMELFHYDFLGIQCAGVTGRYPTRLQAGQRVLFDYEKKNPLTNEAAVRAV